MSSESIAKRLTELLAYFSGARSSSIHAGSTAQNTQGWDSAANLNFIAALEDEHNVTIAAYHGVAVPEYRTSGAFAKLVQVALRELLEKGARRVRGFIYRLSVRPFWTASLERAVARQGEA